MAGLLLVCVVNERWRCLWRTLEGRKVDEDRWFNENDDCRCMSADLSESKGMEVDGHNNRSQDVGWAGLPAAGGK